MSLTVAIPSFNRANAAKDAVKTLKPLVSTTGTKLLLANNGSSESYREAENEISKVPSGKYFEFPDNKGFALNLTRLLSKIETKFVLVLSDEDDLDSVSLQALIDFLSAKNPTLVTLRSESRKSAKLKTRELKGSSSYISGLVFNMESTIEILPKIENLIESEEFAFLYPQVLIAAYLDAKGKSYSLSSPKVINRVELPTSVRGRTGNEYWLPTERVIQYVSLMRCVDKLSLWTSEKERKKLEKFRKANKSNLFGLLFDSVKTISPDILSDLARSSFKTALHFEIRKLGR